MELNRKEVESIKENYKRGMIVRCNHMDDPFHPVPSGTKGVIKNVDDAGTIHVAWENGSSLGLVPNVDSYSLDKEPYRELAKKLSFVFCEEQIFLGINENNLIVVGYSDDLTRCAENPSFFKDWKEFCNDFKFCVQQDIKYDRFYLTEDELRLLEFDEETINYQHEYLEEMNDESAIYNVDNDKSEIFGKFEDFSFEFNKRALGDTSLLMMADRLAIENGYVSLMTGNGENNENEEEWY